MTDTQDAGEVGVRRTEISLTAPGPFDFASTAHSHGWCALAPTRWGSEAAALHRVERLRSGRVVELRISGAPSRGTRITVQAQHVGELPGVEQEEIGGIVARMFRLTEDLSEFYALCAERGGHWLRLTEGHGRLLCSPTVFEDVIKTTSLQ